MICCGFVICWSAYVVIYVLNVTTAVKLDYNGWYYYYTAAAMQLNSCINPFIYAAKYRDFQTGVRKMLKKSSGSVAVAAR